MRAGQIGEPEEIVVIPEPAPAEPPVWPFPVETPEPVHVPPREPVPA